MVIFERMDLQIIFICWLKIIALEGNLFIHKEYKLQNFPTLCRIWSGNSR